MRFTLPAFLFLVSSASVAGASPIVVTPTANGQQLNGQQLNGQQLNGQQLNGVTLNGQQLNGQQLNGQQLNGLSLKGVAINGAVGLATPMTLNGTMITGSLVDSPMCSHSETTTGAPLPASCNACANIVCNGSQADAHCCSSSWDATCVAEAQSWCTFTGKDLVNATALQMTVVPADGSSPYPVLAVITNIRQPDYWVEKCVGTGDLQTCRTVNQPWNGPNRDVYLYSISYSPDGGKTLYDACPYTDRDGYYNTATAIDGAWESRSSEAGLFSRNGYTWSGGAKIPTQVTGPAFTFACRDNSALAKCIERVGYRPWATRTGYDANGAPVTYSMADDFAACTRMLRADYCGNGVPHTRNGMNIDVGDNVGIQTFTPGFPGYFEAEWAPYGAVCVSQFRFSSDATTASYVNSYCPALSYRSGLAAGNCGNATDYSSPLWPAYTMDYSAYPIQ